MNFRKLFQLILSGLRAYFSYYTWLEVKFDLRLNFFKLGSSSFKLGSSSSAALSLQLTRL